MHDCQLQLNRAPFADSENDRPTICGRQCRHTAVSETSHTAVAIPALVVLSLPPTYAAVLRQIVQDVDMGTLLAKRVLSVRLSTPGRHPKISGFDVAEGSF